MYIAPKITEDGYYTTEPAGMVMAILDSTAVMYIIPFLTIGIIVAIAYGIIKLHHLPKHHWSKMYKTDIGLINILSILGWFYHSLWVVAVIIAFINWKELENIIVRMLQKVFTYPSVLNQQELINLKKNIIENPNALDQNTINQNNIDDDYLEDSNNREITFLKNKE